MGYDTGPAPDRLGGGGRLVVGELGAAGGRGAAGGWAVGGGLAVGGGRGTCDVVGMEQKVAQGWPVVGGRSDRVTALTAVRGGFVGGGRSAAHGCVEARKSWIRGRCVGLCPLVVGGRFVAYGGGEARMRSSVLAGRAGTCPLVARGR